MENDLKEICPIQANRQIPPNPPFSKGEKALGFDGILQRSSPPFEKGRPGGISRKAVSNHQTVPIKLFSRKVKSNEDSDHPFARIEKSGSNRSRASGT
jgi:hypothetical protein